MLPGLAPRGLYIPAYAGDLATALGLLRETRLRPIVLGTSAAASEVIRAAGPAAENLVFPMSSFDAHADSAEVQSFAEAFSARYGTEPEVYAARGYDTVRVLAAAVTLAGSWDADKIHDALLHIDNYEGVTGRLAFDQNGDVVQYPRLFIVRGGQFVAYDRFVEGGGAMPVPVR
jgi:branched-chain amino acid transport system substrate-binding protein